MSLKLMRPGAFFLALACFLLPFLKISCNNKAVYSHAYGYQLAFGGNRPLADQKSAKDSNIQNEGDISDIPMQPIILGVFITLALGFLLSVLYIVLLDKYDRIATNSLLIIVAAACAYYFVGDNSNEYKDLKIILPGIGFALALGIILVNFTEISPSKIFQVIMATASLGLFIYFSLNYRDILKIGEPGPQKMMGQSVTIVVQFMYGYWMAIGSTFLAFILSIIPRSLS